MKLKKLPIGIQTFSTIRNENYIYIDKTQDAFELIDKYKFVFLSRPRRFGKSLFVDTLQCIFEGRKELFEGLYIYDKYDWNDKYPIVKLNFSDAFSDEVFYNGLAEIMSINEKRLGVETDANIDLATRFKQIIQRSFEKYHKPVVVLIDEYDKPILDCITDKEKSDKRRNTLREIYSSIKLNENIIKFAFLTGVSKFSKVSIFSGLNNLVDITLMEQFGNICGYTHNDVETVLNPYLQGVDLEKLKSWYNGYNFLKDKVYNPYDILLFIDNKFSYQNYWFTTGTPTFLVELLKNRHYYSPDIENIKLSQDSLDSFDIENINIEVLLFQTGYLTIDTYESSPFAGYIYKLKIPNNEVRQSFNAAILKMILGKDDVVLRTATLEALQQADLAKFEKLLKTLFESIAYENYTNNNIQRYEGLYAIIIYVFLSSLGIKVDTESSTNKGRMDMVIELNNKVYIMEFKVTQENALQQIKDKNYAAKFLNQNKEIYLVGINFDTEVRNIAKFEYEKIED